MEVASKLCNFMEYLKEWYMKWHKNIPERLSVPLLFYQTYNLELIESNASDKIKESNLTANSDGDRSNINPNSGYQFESK